MRIALIAVLTAAAVSGPALAQVQDRYSPGRPTTRMVAFTPAPASVTAASPSRVWPQTVASAATPRPRRLLTWPGKISGPATSSPSEFTPVPAAPERVAAYVAPRPVSQAPVRIVRATPPPPPVAAAPTPEPEYLQPADRQAALQAPVSNMTQPPRAALPTSIYAPTPRPAPAPVQADGDPRPDPFARANTTFSLPTTAAPTVAPQAQSVPFSGDPRPDPFAAASAPQPVHLASAPQPQRLAPAPLPPRPQVRGGAPVSSYSVSGIAPRRYSVHRSFGQSPDPIEMPKEFFNEGLVDMAEPPPPLPPKVNEKGKTPAQVKAAERRASERASEAE